MKKSDLKIGDYYYLQMRSGNWMMAVFGEANNILVAYRPGFKSYSFPPRFNLHAAVLVKDERKIDHIRLLSRKERKFYDDCRYLRKVILTDPVFRTIDDNMYEIHKNMQGIEPVYELY